MKIGIIGAGNIGDTLTQGLAALRHQISVAHSRGPETLHELAVQTGGSAVSVTEAARDKHLVIVTIIVVDTGNYYPQQRDGHIDAIEQGMTESYWVGQQLGRPVSKTSISPGASSRHPRLHHRPRRGRRATRAAQESFNVPH
jgi:8-hydroxy-5-deazaflavin:NADPH oxidoreductase